jgi:hypothetical protein
MKRHWTKRIISGVKYYCLDIGCPDFDQAKRNREMVASGDKVAGYIEIEEAVEHTPLDQPMPKKVTLGEIPYITNNELKELGGSKVADEENLYWEVVINQRRMHYGRGS